MPRGCQFWFPCLIPGRDCAVGSWLMFCSHISVFLSPSPILSIKINFLKKELLLNFLKISESEAKIAFTLELIKVILIWDSLFQEDYFSELLTLHYCNQICVILVNKQHLLKIHITKAIYSKWITKEISKNFSIFFFYPQVIFSSKILSFD